MGTVPEFENKYSIAERLANLLRCTEKYKDIMSICYNEDFDQASVWFGHRNPLRIDVNGNAADMIVKIIQELERECYDGRFQPYI